MYFFLFSKMKRRSRAVFRTFCQSFMTKTRPYQLQLSLWKDGHQMGLFYRASRPSLSLRRKVLRLFKALSNFIASLEEAKQFLFNPFSADLPAAILYLNAESSMSSGWGGGRELPHTTTSLINKIPSSHISPPRMFKHMT